MDITQWYCPSVCLFICLSPMRSCRPLADWRSSITELAGMTGRNVHGVCETRVSHVFSPHEIYASGGGLLTAPINVSYLSVIIINIIMQTFVTYTSAIKLNWSHQSEVRMHSPSSRMRFMSHNWSATKQHLYQQNVAEISHHSVLSGDRIRQC